LSAVESLTEPLPSGHRLPASEKVAVPFAVHRSKTNELPVYTEFKNKKARHSTIVRKISGDLDAFEQELRKLVGARPVIKQRAGSFEIYTHNNEVFANLIRDYLLRLGF
jgi:large subunit ribosomal protein L49